MVESNARSQSTQGPLLSHPVGPFQREPFLDAWADTRGRVRGRRIVHLEAVDEAGVPIALPIEIVRFGPLRIGRFPGETHANANAPLEEPKGRLDLCAAARRHGIDALDLRRIPDPGWLPADATVLPAAEARFAITLDGGLDAVLERGNAKRKRKKFRSQQRHFEAKGGYRFGDLDGTRRGAAIAFFLTEKARRFAELGRPDPFREPGIPAFLDRLFGDPAAGARLYALESGGSIKAMMAGIVEGGTFWGMVSAFANDEDAEASPGELLLWHLVETLSAEGLRSLDLGPGEERYKRSWCDVVVPQFDASLAVTRKGRLVAAGARARARLVRRVKSNGRLLAFVQRLRRALRRS